MESKEAHVSEETGVRPHLPTVLAWEPLWALHVGLLFQPVVASFPGSPPEPVLSFLHPPPETQAIAPSHKVLNAHPETQGVPDKEHALEQGGLLPLATSMTAGDLLSLHFLFCKTASFTELRGEAKHIKH